MRRAFAGAVLGQLLCSAAAAQVVNPEAASVADPQSNAPAQEANAPTGGIEDIVVTARRRNESSQDVPVAVTAFSADDLQRRDLVGLEDIGAAAPQLTVARSMTGSGAQITLRGIGSNPGSIGIEQSVAVVVDSVYYGQGRTINEGFFDLSGLEILKGPQALFFGKNATAGVISITTANPGPKFEAIARAGYEFNADQVYTEGIISGPVTDTFGARLAVRGSRMFGSLIDNLAVDQPFFTTDIATGQRNPHVARAGYPEGPRERELLGRLTLLWDPTDRLTATLKVNGSINDTNNGAWNAVIAACSTGFSTLNPTVPCRRDFIIRQNFIPADIAQEFPLARSDGATFNHYRSWAATGNIDYRLDQATLTAVLNYNYNRNDLTVDADNQSYGPANVYATERTSYNAFSAEVRGQTTFDGPLNGLLGLYYLTTKRDFDQFAFTGNFENSAASAGNRYVAFSKDSQTEGDTYSIYGQLSWAIIPRLELTAGGRYIHETKSSYFVHPYADPRLAGRYRVGQRVDSDQTFDDFTPEVTLTWRPTDDLTLYGAYKTAYKSGGFSNSGTYTFLGDAADLSFDPETAEGFEIGVKSTLFDRQLRLNFAAYHYDYDGFQIDFTNSVTFNFITTNAGSVKQEGFEVEAQFAPSALTGFTLRGNANFNKSRYGEFIAPCYAGQTPAMGCNLRAFSGTTAQDLAGQPTNNAPRWTAALGATYRFDIGGDMQLEFATDGRYSDSYFASSFLSPLSLQDSYVNLDGTIRLSSVDDRWQVALIGKNLTDNFVVTGVQDAPLTGSGTGTSTGRLADQRSFVALPRTVQVQVTYRY